jgi:hypothetical protein
VNRPSARCVKSSVHCSLGQSAGTCLLDEILRSLSLIHKVIIALVDVAVDIE